MSLGKRIKKAIKDHPGLNQKKLAEMVGINRSTITRILKDEHDAKVSTIRDIAIALDADLNWLLIGEERAPVHVLRDDNSVSRVSQKIEMSGKKENLNVQIGGKSKKGEKDQGLWQAPRDLDVAYKLIELKQSELQDTINNLTAVVSGLQKTLQETESKENRLDSHPEDQNLFYLRKNPVSEEVFAALAKWLNMTEEEHTNQIFVSLGMEADKKARRESLLKSLRRDLELLEHYSTKDKSD